MRCLRPPHGFPRISGESRPSHLVVKAFPLRSGLRLPSSGIPLFVLLHQTYLPPIWGQAVPEDMGHLPSPSQRRLHVQALALGDLLSHQPHPHPPASSAISATRNSFLSAPHSEYLFLCPLESFLPRLFLAVLCHWTIKWKFLGIRAKHKYLSKSFPRRC